MARAAAARLVSGVQEYAGEVIRSWTFISSSMAIVMETARQCLMNSHHMTQYGMRADRDGAGGQPTRVRFGEIASSAAGISLLQESTGSGGLQALPIGPKRA